MTRNPGHFFHIYGFLTTWLQYLLKTCGSSETFDIYGILGYYGLWCWSNMSMLSGRRHGGGDEAEQGADGKASLDPRLNNTWNIWILWRYYIQHSCAWCWKQIFCNGLKTPFCLWCHQQHSLTRRWQIVTFEKVTHISGVTETYTDYPWWIGKSVTSHVVGKHQALQSCCSSI